MGIEHVGARYCRAHRTGIHRRVGADHPLVRDCRYYWFPWSGGLYDRTTGGWHLPTAAPCCLCISIATAFGIYLAGVSPTALDPGKRGGRKYASTSGCLVPSEIQSFPSSDRRGEAVYGFHAQTGFKWRVYCHTGSQRERHYHQCGIALDNIVQMGWMPFLKSLADKHLYYP